MRTGGPSRSRRGSEGGAVIVAVLGIGAILAIVLAGAGARAIGMVRAADAARARLQALHAAESVIAATIDRLERDEDGWTSPGGPDPAGLSHGWSGLIGALAGAPAGASPGDVEVRLDVEHSDDGSTTIRAEGRARGQRRAVLVVVRPESVADLAWGAVHATVDPAVTGGDGATCGRHRWEDGLHPPGTGPVEPESATDGTACRRTRFDSGLAVTGPVHLDDTPRIDAAWLPSGPMTTSAPVTTDVPSPAALTPSDAVALASPFGLRSAPSLQLPIDPFEAVAKEATCILRGPTLLRLDGASVRVRSPRSLPVHDAPDAPTVSCDGLDRSRLAGIATVMLPPRAVILVRSDPTARCADHPLGIDPSEDDVTEQACGDGTAYVWGRYLGARSIIAEVDVQLVWDVEPGTAGASGGAGTEGARLGLVAGRSVVLRRPVGPPLRVVAPFGTDVPFAGSSIPPFGAHPEDAPSAIPVRWEHPRIVASMAALGGSFRVQNPRRGQWSEVPVEVVGSVVQRFVGPTLWERRDGTGALQGRTGRALRIVAYPDRDVPVAPALPRLRGGRLRILAWDEVAPGSDGAAP